MRFSAVPIMNLAVRDHIHVLFISNQNVQIIQPEFINNTQIFLISHGISVIIDLLTWNKKCLQNCR